MFVFSEQVEVGVFGLLHDGCQQFHQLRGESGGAFMVVFGVVGGDGDIVLVEVDVL